MPAFDFVLAGRYKLIAPLGEGGMASVYRARDLRLNREVAIKILRDDLTRDPEFLQRFEREAQIVASLSHPNIVSVHDVGEDGGAHFIVMEYVRGRTLAERLERDGRLPPEEAVAILQPVLEALGYAHRQGLVHRDVKPQNILIAPNGTPRLADFGIAHLVGSSATRTAAILGSAHYLSPEQSRGEDATAQSDIYACGVVLWEMLAGRPPFDGPNALAIANQHLQSPPPPLRAEAPAVGLELEEVVVRALAKDPAERFQDVDEFSSALRDVQSLGSTTLVRPLPADVARPIQPSPTAVEHVTSERLTIRRSARKTYLIGLAAALLLAIVVEIANLVAQRYAIPSYPSAPYLLVPGAAAVAVFLFWLNTRTWIYSLDGHAAVVQWGLLTHRRLAIPLHQIGSVRLKQSPLDRIIGVGTVELAGRDGEGVEERLVMEDVPHPRATYQELLHILAAAGRRNRDL